MKSDSCFEDFAHLDKLHEFSKNRLRTLACIFWKTPVQMSTERVPHLWYCLRFVNMFQTMNCSIDFPTFYQKSKTWLILFHLPNLWETQFIKIVSNLVHHDLTRLFFKNFFRTLPLSHTKCFRLFLLFCQIYEKNAKILI